MSLHMSLPSFCSFFLFSLFRPVDALGPLDFLTNPFDQWSHVGTYTIITLCIFSWPLDRRVSILRVRLSPHVHSLGLVDWANPPWAFLRLRLICFQHPFFLLISFLSCFGGGPLAHYVPFIYSCIIPMYKMHPSPFLFYSFSFYFIR